MLWSQSQFEMSNHNCYAAHTLPIICFCIFLIFCILCLKIVCICRSCGYAYRSDDTGAVRANQSGLVLCLEDVGDADHVVLGDTLSNADNETDLSSNSLLDTGGGERGRDEDGGGVGASLLHSIGDIGEDGLAKVLLAGLLGVGSADNVGAVLDGLLGVEGTLLAGEALEDNLGLVANAQVGVGGGVAGGGCD